MPVLVQSTIGASDSLACEVVSSLSMESLSTALLIGLFAALFCDDALLDLGSWACAVFAEAKVNGNSARAMANSN